MKKVTVLFLFATLLSCGSTPSVDTSQDWPRWRGPNGDGISMETDWNPQALAGGPKVLWARDIGRGYSNIVIQRNRLYAIGRAKNGPAFSCLDARSGRMIWHRTLSSCFWETESTPAIDGDRVYAVDQEGSLSCLRAENGTVL
jgi:outer membrane protein assembly factor BamB